MATAADEVADETGTPADATDDDDDVVDMGGALIRFRAVCDDVGMMLVVSFGINGVLLIAW